MNVYLKPVLHYIWIAPQLAHRQTLCQVQYKKIKKYLALGMYNANLEQSGIHPNVEHAKKGGGGVGLSDIFEN